MSEAGGRGAQILAPPLLLATHDFWLPRYNSSPLDFQTFLHPCLLSRGYKSQRLDLNLHGLAERASMAASYLHLPSKSHRGIAKKFVQVNSLHQINVKNAIRT